MKLGVLVETEDGLTWDRWRRIVAAAEDLGFDSVWVSDHLLAADGQYRGGLDTWLALSVAAVQTRRITLGPLVAPITFYRPGVLARTAANLYELSDGRFVLGLGIGWNKREHAAFGIPFPPGPERLQMLGSGLERMPRGIPVLIGGMGAGTLWLVARYADEWNLTTNDPARYRGAAEELGRRCQTIGRDPSSIRRSVAVGVLIGRDAGEVCARAERLRRLVPDLEDVPTDQVVAQVRERGWVAGTPAEVLDALRALAGVGVERAMLGHYDQDDTAALELIAQEVLPWI